MDDKQELYNILKRVQVSNEACKEQDWKEFDSMLEEILAFFIELGLDLESLTMDSDAIPRFIENMFENEDKEKIDFQFSKDDLILIFGCLYMVASELNNRRINSTLTDLELEGDV